MTNQAAVNWPTCRQDGCIGIRLAESAACLAHTSDKDRTAALQQLSETGAIDASGVPITEALLERILAAVPDDTDNHPTFKAPRFNRATFQGDAWFHEAHFLDNAGFHGAHFQGNASFAGATFQGVAVFDEATFQGMAGFDRATFQREARFGGATFQREARFGGATFQGATQFGPLKVGTKLTLDDTTFVRAMRFEVTAFTVRAQRLRLEGSGGTVRLTHEGPGEDAKVGDVVLDDAVLQQPLTVAFIDGRDVPLRSRGRLPRPAILGLVGVDASNLVLVDVDLGSCRFAGAHHLDQLRIEGPAAFANTPRGRLGWQMAWGWLPVWRWTRRQVLFEERWWRDPFRLGEGPKKRGWSREQDSYHNKVGGSELPGPELPGPERIEVLYRLLRKAQEDAKNEPGAADFYYGEMEMRRKGARGFERVLLWLYWLVAGYGLRASRALVTLLLVVAGFAALFQHFGFGDRQHPGLVTSLLYAGLSTVSVEGKTTELTKHLSPIGETLRIALRVTGPVLLGLAVLAVRNRVKR